MHYTNGSLHVVTQSYRKHRIALCLFVRMSIPHTCGTRLVFWNMQKKKKKKRKNQISKEKGKKGVLPKAMLTQRPTLAQIPTLAQKASSNSWGFQRPLMQRRLSTLKEVWGCGTLLLGPLECTWPCQSSGAGVSWESTAGPVQGREAPPPPVFAVPIVWLAMFSATYRPGLQATLVKRGGNADRVSVIALQDKQGWQLVIFAWIQVFF